jgi:hypothetical protein
MNQKIEVGPRFRAWNSVGFGFSSLKFSTADVAELAQKVLALSRPGLDFLC